MIKGNYYFIALKRDTNVTHNPLGLFRFWLRRATAISWCRLIKLHRLISLEPYGKNRPVWCKGDRRSYYETTYGEGNTLLGSRGRLDFNLINTSLQTFRGWKFNELTFPGWKRVKASFFFCLRSLVHLPNVMYIKYQEKYYNQFWKQMAFDSRIRLILSFYYH